MSFRGLGQLKVSLNNTNQGKEGSESLDLFHVHFLSLSPIHKKACYYFPQSPFCWYTCRSPLSYLSQVESLTRFNSRWALAFLMAHLHSQTVSPHYSWGDLTVFPSIVCSLLMFEFCQELLFVHVGLLPSLPAFLHVGMDQYCRRWTLKINQLWPCHTVQFQHSHI